MMTLELYSDPANDSTLSVRMTYQGDVMRMTGCPQDSDLCPWPTFVTVSNTIIAFGASCARPSSWLEW